MHKPSKSSIFCTGIVLSSLLLSGCGKKALINGLVKDNFGQPIPGVTVSIQGTTFRASTGSEGRYQLGYVPGTLVVTYEKAGYSSATQQFQISIESSFPAQDTVMTRIPTGKGIFVLTEKDYIPLVEGHLQTSITSCSALKEHERNMCNFYGGGFAEAKYFAKGDFKKLHVADASGANFNFVNTNGAETVLLRLDGDLIMRQHTNYPSYETPPGYRQEIFMKPTLNWAPGTTLYSVFLREGRYALAVPNLTNYGWGVNLAAPSPPLYLIQIQVGQSAKTAARAATKAELEPPAHGSTVGQNR